MVQDRVLIILLIQSGTWPRPIKLHRFWQPWRSFRQAFSNAMFWTTRLHSTSHGPSAIAELVSLVFTIATAAFFNSANFLIMPLSRASLLISSKYLNHYGSLKVSMLVALCTRLSFTASGQQLRKALNTWVRPTYSVQLLNSYMNWTWDSLWCVMSNVNWRLVCRMQYGCVAVFNPNTWPPLNNAKHSALRRLQGVGGGRYQAGLARCRTRTRHVQWTECWWVTDRLDYQWSEQQCRLPCSQQVCICACVPHILCLRVEFHLLAVFVTSNLPSSHFFILGHILSYFI